MPSGISSCHLNAARPDPQDLPQDPWESEGLFFSFSKASPGFIVAHCLAMSSLCPSLLREHFRGIGDTASVKPL